jgi:dTDP-4-dehydrorhamnose 3,5-epimerase
MEILVETLLGGAKKITLPSFYDERGALVNGPYWPALNGLPRPIRSVVTLSKPGVLRGLHFQHDPPLSRYVRFMFGKVYDVIVDINRSSETFGKYIGIVISDPATTLYLPSTVAHGFYALDTTVTLYDMCASYNENGEATIRYDDESIDIDWPIHNDIDFVVSDRDLGGILLKDVP